MCPTYFGHTLSVDESYLGESSKKKWSNFGLCPKFSKPPPPSETLDTTLKVDSLFWPFFKVWVWTLGAPAWSPPLFGQSPKFDHFFFLTTPLSHFWQYISLYSAAFSSLLAAKNCTRLVAPGFLLLSVGHLVPVLMLVWKFGLFPLWFTNSDALPSLYNTPNFTFYTFVFVNI